jgi:hypothetical protein
MPDLWQMRKKSVRYAKSQRLRKTMIIPARQIKNKKAILFI